MRYMSIGKASEFLGVSVSTLRRWSGSGFLKPDYVTSGGRRRYGMPSLLALVGEADEVSKEGRVFLAHLARSGSSSA